MFYFYYSKYIFITTGNVYNINNKLFYLTKILISIYQLATRGMNVLHLSIYDRFIKTALVTMRNVLRMVFIIC